MDYFGYENRQDRSSQTISNYQDHQDVQIRNVNDQYIDNYGISLDMEHPLPWATLSYGGKLLFTQNRNRLMEVMKAEDDADEREQRNYFKYREDVQALYADIVKNFGEQWTVKAGLRFENTVTEGISTDEEDFKRHYAKWFPSVFVNYKAGENHNFNLSYSRRIERPGFWALNPARWYINAISYTEGNPFLQPTFTDNVELKHVFKNKLTSTLFVTQNNQASDQIPSVNKETNQQIYSMANYYDLTTYGIREGFEFSPTRWWKSTSQSTLSYSAGDYKEDFAYLGKMNGGLSFQFYTNHNFYLNPQKTWQLEATYTYNSPRKILMYELRQQSALDLGIRALFLNEKLQASLTFNDVFKGKNSVVTTYTNDVKQVYGNYYDTRNVNLSLTYKFGNENLKSKQREAQNRDIQNRAD